MDPGRRWVLPLKGVGVASWVMPHVAIIDTWGLNDRVVARNRPAHETSVEQRMMAHDRQPPAGYVECFRPNMAERGAGNLVYLTRDRPLTAEEIVACESRDWAAEAAATAPGGAP